MNHTVAIDPGLEKVAYSIWLPDGSLGLAGLVQCEHEVGMERGAKWKAMGYWTCLALEGFCRSDIDLVIEVPQVYSGPRKEDPNDLIDLAGVLGAIVGGLTFGHVEWSPTPREWKGQLPKEISRARVDSKLKPEEKTRIIWPIKSLCHNVYDALHLGIVYLEREGLRDFSK